MPEKAPAFRLAADDGKTYSLAGLKGQTFVLYFYPKDDTPGCTREAIEFSRALGEFEQRKVKVFGVSQDSLERHARFRDKHQLQITLLSDPELTAHKAFGAYGEKKLYGRTFMGTLRSTFVIDPSGKIVAAYRNVKVDGHVEKVLRDLDGAEEAPAAKKVVAKQSAAASGKKVAAKKAAPKPSAAKTTQKKR